MYRSISQPLDGEERGPSHSSEIAETRQHCTPLPLVTYTLISVLSWRPKSRAVPNTANFGDVETSLLVSIHDSCSRCLSILFDLYPVAVVGQIVGGNIANREKKDDNGGCDAVIADILTDRNFNEKIKLRILKLLHAMVKLLPSMSNRSSEKLADFFMKPRISAALDTLLLAGDGAVVKDGMDAQLPANMVEISKKIMMTVRMHQDNR